MIKLKDILKEYSLLPLMKDKNSESTARRTGNWISAGMEERSSQGWLLGLEIKQLNGWCARS